MSHLEEVYRRRLFAHYKCSSIYDYCIRILGYSNGEAHKKISACKLASHCEGVKESIARGELSLSNAASVQVFLDKRAKQQDLHTGSSHNSSYIESSVMNDISTGLNDENRDFSTMKSQPSVQTLNPRSIIERVKNKNTRECEIELEKIAKESGLKLPEFKPSKRHYGHKTMLKVTLESEKLQLLKSRLKIRCEQELLQLFVDEKLTATNPTSNLRLLCRSCNQRAAIVELGLGKMDRYINKSSTLPEGQAALKKFPIHWHSVELIFSRYKPEDIDRAT